MPKLSKESVASAQSGPATEWRADLNGYAVSIVRIGADTDLTELLKGLPDDQCPSPHWGYVLAGSMWFRGGDQEKETYGAGDAFYVPAGHTAGASEGAEFVIFSPAEIMAPVEAHIGMRARELFGG